MIEEKEDFSVAAGIILAVTAALFIFYNINNYFKRTSEIEEQRTVSEFEIMITEKLMNLEYHFLEDAKYLDLKEKALTGIKSFNICRKILLNISEIFEKLLIVSGILGLILAFSLTLFLMLLAAEVILVFIIWKNQKKSRFEYESLMPLTRKYNYFFRSVCLLESQKDVRLYNMAELLENNFLNFNKMLTDRSKKINELEASSNIFSAFTTYISNAVVIVYAALRIVGTDYGLVIGK